jgi:hypothetical protein
LARSNHFGKSIRDTLEEMTIKALDYNTENQKIAVIEMLFSGFKNFEMSEELK